MACSLNQIKAGKISNTITDFVRAASIGLEDISFVNLGIKALQNHLLNDNPVRSIHEMFNEERNLVKRIASYRRYVKI